MSTRSDQLHKICIDGPVLTPDDGLMIGNGDLSVCVYQTADAIVFRLGKGDVWDRRIDMSDSPRPAHIGEFARGVREEGWRLNEKHEPEATRGLANDPQRMREVCGAPLAYSNRPYPCPKPVGELALHLPVDLTGLRLTQRVCIEDGSLHIECKWDSGVTLALEASVAAKENLLLLRWRRANWNHQTTVAPGRAMAWFSLYRWADPTIEVHAARHRAACEDAGMSHYGLGKPTPLPPPQVIGDASNAVIEQRFHADPTFPDGFAVHMAGMSANYQARPLPASATGEARIHYRVIDWERETGAYAVGVATSREAGGVNAALSRTMDRLGPDADVAIDHLFQAAREAAHAFWSRSSLRCSDPVIENTWYETLHARRCCYRAGTVPPALLLPCSLRDYAPWHGDYHTNYNIQSPFWGDYTANHIDGLADAFLDVADFFRENGRKIARDYFGCRGVYVSLAGYPLLAADDPTGTAPIGRMVYMTGWIANHFWWRYLYTLDKDWLRDRGYPALREFALFYLDFLSLGDDGRYHAFPSTQGEDAFPTTPEACTDRPQVMRHIRYCLRAAIGAAEALDTDAELLAQWRDRLERMAPDNPSTNLAVGHWTPELFARVPPEFFAPDGGPNPIDDPGHILEMPFNNDPTLPSPWLSRANTPTTAWSWRLWTWYFGKVPWYLMICLRNGIFFPQRDWPLVRELIQRWRRPNGLHTAMAAGSFGQIGGWTEQLGLIAPLQEMTLQSWKGWIELFPAWPASVDGEFTTLRAEGAFLVSARMAGQLVDDVTIKSEKGGVCCVRSPWARGMTVRDSDGRAVEARGERGIWAFDTRRGETYRLKSPSETSA